MAAGHQGDGVQGMDPKTALNQFCQKYARRPITKEDIVYTTNKYGTEFQSIVQLNCLQGEQFAGETHTHVRGAEKSAAQQALLAHASTIASLPVARAKGAVQKNARGGVGVGIAGADGSGPCIGGIGAVRPPVSSSAVRGGAVGSKDSAASGNSDNPAVSAKVRLNTACMKIARRYLRKGDTLYTTKDVIGGFQATLALSCLPGDWAAKVWAGEVCSSKQKAEQSVAAIALTQIQSDPALVELFDRPASTGAKKGQGGGRGCGEGQWFSGGADLPREKLETYQDVTGEVLEWKVTFGWIKPSVEIDHPASALRQGKIYVNQKDVGSGEDASLSPGCMVKFQVYVDCYGLGACDLSTI
eukprot:TRINITY_DN10291_c0_g1_i1.p1 TRINITY_DN10291_c0_g1~~TRINITY_DN10291_c0_g1_i1.p1  ORF type:complete len:357 (+),score=65.55 TRINITY_DN10291_c0_g1_i1:99-1169(+)